MRLSFKHTKTVALAILAVALMLGGVGQAKASSVLIGAPGDPGSGNQFPFGGNTVTTYQQVYNANLFPVGSISINAIDFFNNNYLPGSINPATYTVFLSTTGLPVNGLAFGAPSSNLGPDNTQFFSGILGGPIDPVTHEFTINGGPFTYNSANGNLLLEIVTSNATPTTGTVFLDANEGTFGTQSSRSYDVDPNGNFSNSYGLVTEFDYGPHVAPSPEPASLTLLGISAVGLLGYGWRRRRNKAAKAV